MPNCRAAMFSLKWKRAISARTDFQLQAYYDRTNRYEPNLGENRDTVDLDILVRSKLSTRQELSYGLGARASDGRFIEVSNGLVFSPLHRLDDLLSGFVQDDINLGSIIS